MACIPQLGNAEKTVHLATQLHKKRAEADSQRLLSYGRHSDRLIGQDMMNGASDSRMTRSALAVALGRALACGLPLAIALTASTAAMAAKSSPKPKLVLETPITPFKSPVIDDNTNFSFTVPGAASARAQTVERAFRFTPSGQSDNRKALSVGVATRVNTPAPDRSRALAAAEPMVINNRAYNVDVSIAWKGFALNTGFSHSEPSQRSTPLSAIRDSVDLGLSYGGANWRTSLQGTAEERSDLGFTSADRRYSVALGGAYMVAPRLSVTGGVRYKLAPEAPTPLESNRADQSVYVGTNIAF